LNIDLLNYSLKLLGNRDYFTIELKMKLIERGYKEKEIDEIIYYLKQKKFLDDDSLLEKKISILQNKGWGEFKILKYFLEKGLEKNFVKEGIKNYLDLKKEKENIKRLSQKKDSLEKKLRYLISKGFRESLILEVLNEKEDEI
jgi:SOS response regulatory protein OraA/RecX